MRQQFVDPAAIAAQIKRVQASQKIAHFPLDFLCKHSVSGGQRSPYAEAAPTLKTGGHRDRLQ